jgi:hypothetical protein
MRKHIFGAVGFSVLLSLGSLPTTLLAHEGHQHREQRGGYEEQEDSGRSDPWYDDERWDEEYDDEDTYGPSSRRYPPPDWQRSAPREPRDRPWSGMAFLNNDKKRGGNFSHIRNRPSSGSFAACLGKLGVGTVVAQH